MFDTEYTPSQNFSHTEKLAFSEIREIMASLQVKRNELLVVVAALDSFSMEAHHA